ncbi:hypothetical protein [Actinoplanes sp. NPDC049681]|uniref:hypothetical protein n=1 Tax=Actinoplanes sp. NPDC049681 TaxID=3363905 RepID=UPI0037B40FFB
MSYPQNDPRRAGGLISDAQGEFVEQEGDGGDEVRGGESGEPPMEDNRMVGPREEIDKAR